MVLIFSKTPRQEKMSTLPLPRWHSRIHHYKFKLFLFLTEKYQKELMKVIMQFPNIMKKILYMVFWLKLVLLLSPWT
jgi:hypothetical protein